MKLEKNGAKNQDLKCNAVFFIYIILGFDEVASLFGPKVKLTIITDKYSIFCCVFAFY